MVLGPRDPRVPRYHELFETVTHGRSSFVGLVDPLVGTFVSKQREREEEVK